MSDIPVGRRKESRLQAQIEAYKVRDVMTVELFRNFGVNEKKLDAFIEKQTAHIKDEELKKREQEAIRKRIESAIEDERKTISDLSRGITGHLRAANTIYPEIWEEYVERRVQLDFDIENDFKGWLGSNYKYMSFEQIKNMIVLYDLLFERTPQWEKGRLRWMTDKVMQTREDDAYVGI